MSIGGYDVRALVRRNSNTLALENLGVEETLGDLRDRESIAKALKDCQGVFHCAAMYTFWSRDPSEVYRVNVEGTKVIFEEAERAGVERAVYTSTVSTIGLPKKGLGYGRHAASTPRPGGPLQEVQVSRRTGSFGGRKQRSARSCRQPRSANRPVGRETHPHWRHRPGLPPQKSCPSTSAPA